MLNKLGVGSIALAGLLALASVAHSANLTADLTKGTVDLKTAGPLAFAPDGVLLVGDPDSAAIFAIATGDTSGNPQQVKLNIDGLNNKIAAVLGTTPKQILINDLAVNPLSGNAYLSVTRGQGPDAAAVLLRIDAAGKISEVSLKNVPFAKAELPNAPAPGGTGRRNQRRESITDLAYFHGSVIVAGLSNEEFASTLRSIPFPFKTVSGGTGVEIFHGAHGRFETRSPVRTFTTYNIADEPHLLAAYTCTPLVKFSLNELKAGSKVKGVTVAELGNRNRPLDMFVYKQGGQDYVLLANSSRGVMKITTENLADNDGIGTKKINGTAGQTYDTIEELKGIVQLDRLNKKNALVLVQTDDGSLNLRTIALP